jgi:tetratricopeptide (TPR) repeat protein
MVLCGLLIMLFLPACSWYEQTGSNMRSKRGRTITKRVKGPQGTIPLEVKRPEGVDMAAATTPKRMASQQLVDNGKIELMSGDLEKAVQTFQEAVTIDGSHGVAYYYLARAHYQLGHLEQAMGLLERAEALLNDSQDWVMTVEALREMIRTEQ